MHARLPVSLQQLPPAQARFCLAAARFLEKDLAVALQGAKILVALSGGADSSALLLCLRCLSQSKGFSLRAAHLDHALRPSSAEEAEQCRRLCESLSIPFSSRRVDVAALSQEEKTGVEACARKVRYAFFSSLADDEGCDWIAFGHNKNDLAEDMLMRLMRGAGWPGLGGMRAIDEKRRLLRPLLMTSREEIEAFLQGLGIAWIEDESNADAAYFRNRVRNTLLPLILKENPAFLESAAGLWRLARADERYFSEALAGKKPLQELSVAPGEGESSLFTPMAELRAMPQALRLRLYKSMLDKLGSGQALLDNLLRLDASLADFISGAARHGQREHQFPGGKTALVSSKGICWKP